MVVPRGVLLWGEGERSGDNGASQGASEGVSDVKGDKNDDDDDELSTAVEVALCIDTKAKTYTLTVTGLGPLALIRWRRLQRLVQDAMLYRRHSMQLPSWMPYHREAMATSDVLKGAPPHSRLLHVPLPCDGMRTFKMSYLWHPLTPILSLSHPHYPTLSFPPSHSHPLFPAFSLPSSLSRLHTPILSFPPSHSHPLFPILSLSLPCTLTIPPIDLENHLKVTVLFQSTKDKAITTDTVALTKESQAAVICFLESLQPKQDDWYVKQTIPPPIHTISTHHLFVKYYSHTPFQQRSILSLLTITYPPPHFPPSFQDLSSKSLSLSVDRQRLGPLPCQIRRQI